MSDSGFVGKDLYDVRKSIADVIEETQPHEIDLETILQRALVGSVIYNKSDDINSEEKIVMNVAVLKSKKDPLALRIIAQIVSADSQQVDMFWLSAESFYRCIWNPKLKITMINRDSFEDYLQASGIEVPDGGITEEMMQEHAPDLLDTDAELSEEPMTFEFFEELESEEDWADPGDSDDMC